MKKKLLSIILLVTALILVGCGAEESEGEVAGIYMTDVERYQYQMIKPEEIMVQYADGRPDKKLSDYSGSYTTDTAVYLGNEVGVYLDGEHFSTVVEYVPYTNIDFKRNVGDIDLYILMCRDMEAKTDWFEGTITYADGYVGSIDAKEVELKRNADKLVVKITVWGNDALGYEIVIPEAWDDMNLNEQSQEEINEWYDGLGSGDSGVTEESMSSSVVKDVDTSSWMMQPPANVVMKSHLDLTVDDIRLMKDIYDMHRRSFDSNRAEVIKVGGDYDEIRKEAVKNKGCITFTETLKEGSDWANCFGSASISEVFRAFGYPEYGLDGKCWCTLGANYIEMLSKYGTKDTFSSSNSYRYFQSIPLSEHVLLHLSPEEIEHYIVCTYAVINDCTKEEAYFSDELLRDLYGISKEDLVAKYVNYKPATLEDPSYVYTLAIEYGGYNGDAISWMNLSQEELDNWVLVTLTNLWNTKKGEGGTINPDVANTITMLGGTVS